MNEEIKIKWTSGMLVRFKKRYKLAKFKGEDQFTFDGNEFVTAYAGYLIEYLDGLFKNGGNE